MKPIRRNIAHVSQAARDKLINAIVQIDMNQLYVYPDGVSYWDKQDQIHQVTHIHGGQSFLTWHRELCNRFEALLQEYDPTVALHYWDWTTDPRISPDGQGGAVNLFTNSTFGSSTGRAGEPFDSLDNNGRHLGSREQTGKPSDPPTEITRNISAGAPGVASDRQIITTADTLPQNLQWNRFRQNLESNHDPVHGFFGGTIAELHSAFEDPFVFMLHSNVDRLFAMWQTVPGQEWRLDPEQVYGDESDNPQITEYLEPWSGTVHFEDPIPPWVPSDPNNQIVQKNSKHPSIVQPPLYDTIEPPIGEVIAMSAITEALLADVKRLDPVAFHKEPICMVPVSKDLSGRFIQKAVDKQECKSPRCSTLKALHAFELKVTSHKQCDKEPDALDGALKGKLSFAYIDTGEYRGYHTGKFEWSGSASRLIGRLSGVTNAGTHRDPLMDCEKCEAPGHMEGRLDAVVVRGEHQGCRLLATYMVGFDQSADAADTKAQGTLEGVLICSCTD